MKKIILVIVLSILCISSIFDFSEKIKAKTRLNRKNVKLEVSDSYKLKLKGVKGKVKWKSSKPRYAKVNKNGKVKALKRGKVTITAIYKGKKYRCTIIIKKRENENIKTPSPALPSLTPTPHVPTVSPDIYILPTKESEPSASPKPTSSPKPTPTPGLRDEDKAYPTIDGYNYFEKWYVKEICEDSIMITDEIDIGFVFELKLANRLKVTCNAEIILGKYDEEFDVYNDIKLIGDDIEYSDIKIGDIVDVIYEFYPYPDGNSPHKRDYCIGINLHKE